MKPTKMIAVAENIVVQVQGATKTIDIPVGKKVARDLVAVDPYYGELDFSLDNKLETLTIKKGDGKAKRSKEEVEKEQEAAAASASKKKASAKKTAAAK